MFEKQLMLDEIERKLGDDMEGVGWDIFFSDFEACCPGDDIGTGYHKALLEMKKFVESL